MTKKVLAVFLAAVTTLVSLTCAAMMTMFITEIPAGGEDGRIFFILTIAMAAMLATCFFVMHHVNSAYDEAEGYLNNNARISRWVKNLAFADLLVIFLMAMITVSISTGGRPAEQGHIVFLFWAVLFASCLYLIRFSRYAARRRRIRTLKYAASSVHKRRFHFTVYEADANVCSGYVQGKIMTGDQAYVCFPGASGPLFAKVLNIRAEGREVRQVRDSAAMITFDCRQTITANTVISSHHAVHQITPVIQAENPRISGMISVYTQKFADDAYIGILNYDICHGQYLLPARPAKPSGRDMMDPLPAHAAVSFLSVNARTQPDRPCLPVFTDWDALGRYGYVIEEQQSASVVMDFQKCTEVMRQGYTGIVINPFGPRPFYLGEDYIRSLVHTEGYQEEYARGKRNE